MASFSLKTAALAACGSLAAAVLPNPWPNMHTHTEIMYTAILGTLHYKPWVLLYYNPDRLHASTAELV